jgi:hypothetical protein
MSEAQAEKVVESAVRDALADIAPNPAPRAVSVAKVRDRPATWLIRVVFDALDQFGFEIVPERGSPAQVTVRVADQLQRGCGDLTDFDPAEHTPRCPIHRHAARARCVDDVALWCCPDGHLTWSARIGGLA